MFITRLVFTIALSLTGLAALAGFSPLHLIADAMAQSASDVASQYRCRRWHSVPPTPR